MAPKLIYIAGKISGLPPHVARENFREAMVRIKSEGDIPLSPYHKIDAMLQGLRILPKFKRMSEGELWKWCMKRAIAMLTDCDEIAMLPNWKDSNGACIEHDLAKKIGIPVRYL